MLIRIIFMPMEIRWGQLLKCRKLYGHDGRMKEFADAGMQIVPEISGAHTLM
jgi:hypothetical protein